MVKCILMRFARDIDILSLKTLINFNKWMWVEN